MNQFHWANVSDVHLGNNNTQTSFIIENLRRAFPYDSETEKLDMISISGDLLDRLLHYDDTVIEEIEDWATGFLRMCAKYDIVLRVLEGTRSHDRGQSKLFEKINRLGNIGCDVQHVKNLSIEYIERFGKSFLYVPDDWDPDPDVTWKQVQQLLQIHGLKQVDFGIMHGNFPHQLPPVVKAPMHNPDRYQSIVKYVIVIGHVHIYSQYGKIFAPGSFDRLSHGDEEPKGHLRFFLQKDDTWKMKFVENVNAKIYKSIVCTGMDIDEALSLIDRVVSEVPRDSNLRIVANKEDTINAAIPILKGKYPFINWSNKVVSKTKEGNEMLLDLRAVYQGMDITESNLIPLLMERVQNKVTDGELVRRCEIKIKEVTDEH